MNYSSDSWTVHNHSACDLRGIWKGPAPDPSLSVLTKHPSGSVNNSTTADGTSECGNVFHASGEG